MLGTHETDEKNKKQFEFVFNKNMEYFKRFSNDQAMKILSNVMVSFQQIENRFLADNYTAAPIRESLNTMDDVMFDAEQYTEYHVALSQNEITMYDSYINPNSMQTLELLNYGTHRLAYFPVDQKTMLKLIFNINKIKNI